MRGQHFVCDMFGMLKDIAAMLTIECMRRRICVLRIDLENPFVANVKCL